MPERVMRRSRRSESRQLLAVLLVVATAVSLGAAAPAHTTTRPPVVHYGAVEVPTPPPTVVDFSALPPAPPGPGPEIEEPGEGSGPDLTHPGARTTRLHGIAMIGVAGSPSGTAQARNAASVVSGSGGTDPLLVQTQFAGKGNGDPPDPNVAEGAGEVVEATNSGITVYTRVGGVTAGPKSVASFFNSSVIGGDPRIVFDTHVQRWFMTAYLCTPPSPCMWPESIDLAVSQSNDATGLWYVYVADTENGPGLHYDDQPRIGFSDDKIILTWDQIGADIFTKVPTSYDGHEIVRVFALLSAMVGVPVQVELDLGDKHALIPAVRGPGGSGSDAFAVYYNWGLFQDHIGKITISGSAYIPATVSWSQQDTNISALHDPPTPASLTGVGNMDDRFLWATESATGGIWVGAMDKCHPLGDTQDRACGRIIETNGLKTLQDFDLFHSGGDLVYPAPISDCTGSHVIVAASFSVGSGPMHAEVTGAPIPFGKTGFQGVDLASGSNTFTGGRWGDYFGIAPSSDDCDTIWSVSMFGGTTKATTTSTEISEVTFGVPTVEKIVPTEGEPGTKVFVFGHHFTPDAFVAFGSTPATSVQFLSGTELTATSPPHIPGSVDITVTTLNGTSTTTPADVYTYPAVAYVTDDSSNDLFQFDTASLLGSPIPLTAFQPQGLALSPDDSTAWVGSVANRSLQPVDLGSKAAEPEIPVGGPPSLPEGVAISPDGSTVYIANSGTDMVVAVNAATKMPKWSLPVPGGPAHLAITPDGKQLFVTDSLANAVTPIDVSGVVPVPGPTITVSAPMGIAVAPDGLTAYVTDLDWSPATNISHVTPIDTATHVVGTPIPILATDPEYISILPNGATAYVSSTNDGLVFPIALPSLVPGAAIAVGPLHRGSRRCKTAANCSLRSPASTESL